jgi:predicted AlkP superfamily phosphohydrolase/phosphomutase
MPFQERLLILALDMADGELIRRWSEQGHLPHFGALLSSGTWVDLESTAQVLHTSTWPTFATGVHPGKHGVYFPYQPKPGYQLAQHVQRDQYGTHTFWHHADQQECRCIVYDVPETFPEAGFSGNAIFDWGTWAWYGQPCAEPSTLLKEMKSRFGRYPLGFEAKRLGARMPDVALLEKRLLRSIEYKRSTAQWLLQREPWNLAVIGFCEGHPAGHYLWPANIDPASSSNDDKMEALMRVYVAFDRAIGALTDSLPGDAAVFIVSGDGVCPNRCAWYLLPAVLERLGYTQPAARADNGRSASRSFVSRMKGMMSSRMRRHVANCLPWRLRDRLGAREQAANIDWSNTRAFTLPTDLEGCIRINLKGREPQGIVEPGREYSDLCDELRARLMELTNSDSGAPAVRQVWVRNETFPGERQEQLPDLIVAWNNEAPFTSLSSPRIGCIEGDNVDLRPGTHSPDGFLLAAGPGIRKGLHDCGRLVDVAPTAMKILGLTLPPHMDGSPLSVLTSPIKSEATHHGLPAEPLPT